MRGAFQTSRFGLRFFYHHALERAWGLFPGKKRIASPRLKRLPEALSEDQIRQLLGSIRNPVHKTCLAVMYACGLRINEATTLEVGAIDRANQVLRIVGKGNKERLVPLPRSDPRRTRPPVAAPIATAAGCSPIDAATHRSASQVLSGSSPARRPGRGVPRRVTPHTLRHSSATRLIENGSVNIRIVRILLGHSSIASTAIHHPISLRPAPGIAAWSARSTG